MLNNHSFAFVYPLENESVETVNQSLAELVRQINERAPCPISISLSQPTEGSDQVHAALEEARMMMLCDNVPVGLVSLQEEDVKQSVQFKNVVELYQALVRENEERVEQCIGEFWRRNRGTEWSMRRKVVRSSVQHYPLCGAGYRIRRNCAGILFDSAFPAGTDRAAVFGGRIALPLENGAEAAIRRRAAAGGVCVYKGKHRPG